LNSWEVTICNLGHAYRKIRYIYNIYSVDKFIFKENFYSKFPNVNFLIIIYRNYEKAKEQFEMVFSLDPSNYQAYSAMAYIYQIEGRLDEAISYYHSVNLYNHFYFY